jgi:hypothetical protein
VRAWQKTSFAAAGVVNALPAVAAVAPTKLSSLYGIEVKDSSNLRILLQHRSVMLGLVGGQMMAAAFHPTAYTAATATGVISMASYVGIAAHTGGYNANIRKVAWVDVAAGAALAAAYLLHRVAAKQ